MILPSAVRANRIPRGFSRVTIYSLRLILNAGELPDIAKTLTVPPLNRSFSLLVLEELALSKHRSLAQNEEELLPSSNGEGRSRVLVAVNCRESISKRRLSYTKRLYRDVHLISLQMTTYIDHRCYWAWGEGDDFTGSSTKETKEKPQGWGKKFKVHVVLRRAHASEGSAVSNGLSVPRGNIFSQCKEKDYFFHCIPKKF